MSCENAPPGIFKKDNTLGWNHFWRRILARLAWVIYEAYLFIMKIEDFFWKHCNAIMKIIMLLWKHFDAFVDNKTPSERVWAHCGDVTFKLAVKHDH